MTFPEVTVTEKEEQLRAKVLAHGYTHCEIKHFKKHDRVIFGNDKINLSLKLRSKISYVALDALVEACIGKSGMRK